MGEDIDLLGERIIANWKECSQRIVYIGIVGEDADLGWEQIITNFERCRRGLLERWRVVSETFSEKSQFIDVCQLS